MEEVHTIQGSVKFFKMVGFSQWKWPLCLQNKNFDLGFGGPWKHRLIWIRWGEWEEVSLQIRRSYNNIHSGLNLGTNSSIDERDSLNGGKHIYWCSMIRIIHSIIFIMSTFWTPNGGPSSGPKMVDYEWSLFEKNPPTSVYINLINPK